tara:strand:+ start:117 stop:755 length:639 start_codon:yes stop_codon:yes gene_type:complete
MSNIKLVHSGGNSVSLTTPTSNPASNITFKLPQADGSANQVLKTDASGSLSFIEKGKVLQCKVNYNETMVTVTNAVGGDSSEYGLTGGRAYGDLTTVTITPKSSTSTMVIQGVSGCTNSGVSYPSQGAYGVVAILNNAATGAVDNTNYQAYQLSNLMGTSGYLPSVFCQGHYAAGSTTEQVWRLKGYAYTEGSNSCQIRYIKQHLIIWEVEI